jgi:hypothetical protein
LLHLREKASRIRQHGSMTLMFELGDEPFLALNSLKPFAHLPARRINDHLRSEADFGLFDIIAVGRLPHSGTMRRC